MVGRGRRKREWEIEGDRETLTDKEVVKGEVFMLQNAAVSLRKHM